MVVRNLLTATLQGNKNIDVDDVADADRWIDESLEQLELYEEPTLVGWLSTDPDAINSFRSTIMAMHITLVKENSKGTPPLEVTQKLEALFSRYVAASCHKAVLLERQTFIKTPLY